MVWGLIFMLFKMEGIRKRLISVLIQEFRHNYLFKGNAEDEFRPGGQGEHFTGIENFLLESQLYSIGNKAVY